jgi:hypothetical protein
LAEILGYLSLLPSDFQLRLTVSAQHRQLKSTADEIGKGLNMIPTNISPDGQNLTLLEAQLMEGDIQRPAFVEAAISLGVPSATATTEADRYLAIASNQSQLRASLKKDYDYIVVGSGASGSVVAGRLAQNPATQVLLLEDGGSDLKPEILMTVLWFTNEGGKFDWSFNAERSASVNGRSIHQAMGRVLGGGSSINGMVWARGHKNDFDYWAKEGGDSAWDYNHILEIYKRIEDWQGPADPSRRGAGGNVFVQPHPILIRSLMHFCKELLRMGSRPSTIKMESCSKGAGVRPSPMSEFAMAAVVIFRPITSIRSCTSQISRY